MTTTTYITRVALENLFGADEIARLSSDGTSVDATIETVNSEVDSYVLRARPAGIAEVPQSLEMAAANICRYYLYSVNCPPNIENRWKAAVAYLRDVAAGKVALPVIPDDPATLDIDESTLTDGVWFTAIPWCPTGWM